MKILVDAGYCTEIIISFNPQNITTEYVNIACIVKGEEGGPETGFLT